MATPLSQLKRVKPSQVDFVLEHAAAVLEADGWSRGSLGTVDGPKCAIGAINHVLFNQPDLAPPVLGHRAKLRAAVIRRLVDVGGISGAMDGYADRRVTNWNDHYRRTRDEVIEKFRIAAGLPPYPPEDGS